MTSREQFEAWFEADSVPGSTGFFKRDARSPDEYAIFEVQCEWRAWQAARAQALEEAAQVCADWADSLNRDNHHMHTGSNGDLIEAADRCADAIRSMAKE